MSQDKEVTKEEFKKIYFKYGRPEVGFDESYWNERFENERGMKYEFTPPQSKEENVMNIVCGEDTRRIFFLTEEANESFYSSPEY